MRDCFLFQDQWQASVPLWSARIATFITRVENVITCALDVREALVSDGVKPYTTLAELEAVHATFGASPCFPVTMRGLEHLLAYRRHVERLTATARAALSEASVKRVPREDVNG